MEVPCLGALKNYDDAISQKVDEVTEKYKISKHYVEKYKDALFAIADLRTNLVKSQQSNKSDNLQRVQEYNEKLASRESQINQEHEAQILKAKQESEDTVAEIRAEFLKVLEDKEAKHSTHIQSLQIAAQTGNPAAIQTAVETAKRESAASHEVELAASQKNFDEEKAKILQEYLKAAADEKERHAKEKADIEAQIAAAKAEIEVKNKTIEEESKKSRKELDENLAELKKNGNAAKKLDAFLETMEHDEPEKFEQPTQPDEQVKPTGQQAAAEAMELVLTALNKSNNQNPSVLDPSVPDQSVPGGEMPGGTRRKKRRTHTKRRPNRTKKRRTHTKRRRYINVPQTNKIFY